MRPLREPGAHTALCAGVLFASAPAPAGAQALPRPWLPCIEPDRGREHEERLAELVRRVAGLRQACVGRMNLACEAEPLVYEQLEFHLSRRLCVAETASRARPCSMLDGMILLSSAEQASALYERLEQDFARACVYPPRGELPPWLLEAPRTGIWRFPTGTVAYEPIADRWNYPSGAVAGVRVTSLRDSEWYFPNGALVGRGGTWRLGLTYFGPHVVIDSLCARVPVACANLRGPLDSLQPEGRGLLMLNILGHVGEGAR